MRPFSLLVPLVAIGCAGGLVREKSGMMEIGLGSTHSVLEMFEAPHGGRIQWTWRITEPDKRFIYPEHVLFRVYPIPQELLGPDVLSRVGKGEIPPAASVSIRANDRREIIGAETLRMPGAFVLEWINRNTTAPLQVEWSVTVSDSN